MQSYNLPLKKFLKLKITEIIPSISEIINGCLITYSYHIEGQSFSISFQDVSIEGCKFLKVRFGEQSLSYFH